MAIVNLNMGNLNMEVKILTNRLTIKAKATLQEELDKERVFQKEYKHNIKTWRKQRIKFDQKIKTFILKMKEEIKELKEKTHLMKSQIE